jgi:hypothetical protein
VLSRISPSSFELPQETAAGVPLTTQLTLLVLDMDPALDTPAEVIGFDEMLYEELGYVIIHEAPVSEIEVGLLPDTAAMSDAYPTSEEVPIAVSAGAP